MKRKLYCIYVIFSLFASRSYTQVLPLPYTSDVRVNSVRMYETISIGQVRQTTQYFDGLGRPVQTVVKRGSPLGKDIVTATVYDKLGRVQHDFLPFVSSQTSAGNEVTDNGEFKLNPFQQQKAFYEAYPNAQNETYFHGKTVFDGSPLNRVTKTFKPGNSWIGNNVGSSISYDFNTAVENIRIWDLASNTALPTSNNTYQTGKLSKTTAEDENGKKLIVYTDLSGNVILKKVQVKDGTDLTNEHSGWACTYYVYDDFSQLRFVITPKAVEWLSNPNNSWSLSNAIANELSFVYEYDARGRIVAKKQPGAGKAYLVYDKKDRVVLTLDANNDKDQNQLLSTSTWQFSLYDEFDRVIATGLLNNSGDRQVLQTNVDNLPITGLAAVSAATGPGVTQTLSANGPVAGYGPSDAALSNTDVVYNSVTHYDNYNYQGAKPFNSSYTLVYEPPALSTEPTQKTDKVLGFVTGEVLRVLDNDNNSANDKFLFSTAYYDQKGRTIQSLTDNHKGGTDYSVNQFDFVGKLMSSYLFHQINGSPSFTIVTKNEYDVNGRLLKTSKNFNNTFLKTLSQYTYDELGQVKTKRLAPGYAGSGGSDMENLNYSYNIHGWLTGINKDFALSTNPFNQWDHFFGLYLGYDDNTSFAKKEWNGSITGAIWRSQGDNAVRKYNYNYDPLGRFTSAIFHQKKDPGLGWANDMDFSSQVQYEDLNGNIKSLKHSGIIPGVAGSKLIDDLTYRYNDIAGTSLQGNILKEVKDLNVSADNGLNGDFKEGSNSAGTDDYDYDKNGNLRIDLNKNIKIGAAPGIVYNYLNKVQKLTIEKAETTEIEYIYDASGEKLSKTVKKLASASNNQTATTTVTDYIGGFVYETKSVISQGAASSYANQLQYVLHEEGRLKVITAKNDFDGELAAGVPGADVVSLSSFGTNKFGVFEYFIKDNLGNTRMVLTEEEQTETYQATNENNNPANEFNKQVRLFGGADANGVPTPSTNEILKTKVDASSTPWSNYGNSAGSVNQLTAAHTDKRIGPNMLLKVMAGDQISTSVRYFFSQSDPTQGSNPVHDMAQSLFFALHGFKGTSLGQHAASGVQSGTNGNVALASFLTDHGVSSPLNPNAPRAYLNIVFLDEQFNFISNDNLTSDAGSAAKRVERQNEDHSLALSKKAPKNGWVLVFVNNESNASVYFDDMFVKKEHGRIAEESHYYPYGLKIAAISSKAFNKLETNYGYQGEFSEEEEETGWNEFSLRNYDPQTGRWTGTDPYDEFASPYVGMGNDPVSNVDPDGGSIFAGLSSVSQVAVGTLAGAMIGGLIDVISGGDGKKGMLIGAGIGLASGVIGVIASTEPELETSHSSDRPNTAIESRYGSNTFEPPVVKRAEASQSNSQLNTYLKNRPVNAPIEVSPINQNSPRKNFGIKDAEAGLRVVFNKYGREMAEIVERMYRTETRHFESGQYKNTGSGGMEAHGNPPNYGWDNSFFNANPQYKPVGTWSAYEGKGLSGVGGNKQVTNRPKKFVVMPSVEAGMMFKANYIQRYNGNYARWFSTDTKAQEVYRNALLKIKPKIVNTFK